MLSDKTAQMRPITALNTVLGDACLETVDHGYNRIAQSFVHTAMVTIREIADKAGVSPGSVSAVLSGKAKERRIAPHTCELIEGIAASLGYQHNTMARSLRAGKSNLIGIVGHSHPTYHVRRTREAVRLLMDSGYQVTMQDLAWRPQQEAQVVRDLLGLRVDGLYIESGAASVEARDEAQALLREQARRGLPMVRLDQQKGLPVDVVTVDREQGMYLATVHLLVLGHRQIVFVIDDSPAPFVQARLRGFHRALKEWEIPASSIPFIRPEVTGIEDWNDQNMAGRKCMIEALHLPVRPTAMLTASDFLAMGAISAALEHGLSIPDDIAVVGFTDYPEAQLSAVPLTTIAYPFQAMAREAAKMLLERIGGMQGKPRVLTLQPELVVRQSCGAQAGLSIAEPRGDEGDAVNANFEHIATNQAAMA